MKLLKVGKSSVQAMVDDEDYEFLSQFHWRTDSAGYVRRELPGLKMSFLHKDIMQPKSGIFVDHRDGNRLNNQRSNLRYCSHKQNMRNRKVSYNKHSSRYKGVYWQDGKWMARIFSDGRDHYIGRFNTEHQGALAYDLWAVFFFGEFAKTNFTLAEGNS